MRVIIAGGREVTDQAAVDQAMTESGFTVTAVVCGRARGADTLGERWAQARGLPVVAKPADWARYGARAGFVRNREMSEQADALVLVWSGRSPGSQNMLMEAAKRGLKIHQHIIRETDHGEPI